MEYNTDGTCKGADDYAYIVGLMPASLVRALNAGPKPVLPPNPTVADRGAYQSALTVYYRKLVDGKISDVMGEFYTKVYEPATASIAGANVDTFLTTYLEQIKTTSPSAYTFLNTNKADVKTLLVAYFVNQTAGAANTPLTEAQQASANVAADSGYEAILASLGQVAPPDPKCEDGYTLSADKKTCTGTSATDTKTPICDTGFTYMSGACTVTPASEGGGGTTAGTTTETTAGTTAGTTGGSQTFLTSNSGTNKGNIWGPAFSGMGNNAGSGASPGSVRDYPTLIGPKPKASTMVDGAGIVGLSQHETLPQSGALPGASGTGSDPNSQFFGSSRVPGDKDLFPNPYQQFTPSTGSSKTEPVPFLSDFSAFFR